MSNDGVQLTDEQKKRQRGRSIAIGLTLGALVILIFIVSIVKMKEGLGG